MELGDQTFVGNIISLAEQQISDCRCTPAPMETSFNICPFKKEKSPKWKMHL
jgi:hypothetical protein